MQYEHDNFKFKFIIKKNGNKQNTSKTQNLISVYCNIKNEGGGWIDSAQFKCCQLRKIGISQFSAKLRLLNIAAPLQKQQQQ